MLLRRGNLNAGLPDARGAEVIETIAGMTGRQVRIERIVTEGQATPDGEWYDQDWDEWVAVLAGGADLEFTGPSARERLEAGDWIQIPARRRHRVAAAERGTLWLAVHADSPAGSADAPPAENFPE